MENKIQMVTHKCVDFDACLSVWLLETFVFKDRKVEYKFLSANDELDTGIDTVCVDMTPKTVTGPVTVYDHHTTGQDSNARLLFQEFAQLIPESIRVLIEFADLSDKMDVGTLFKKADRKFTSLTFGALPGILRHSRKSDYEVLMIMYPIFEGFLYSKEALSRASDFIEKRVVFHRGGTIASYKISYKEDQYKVNSSLFNGRNVHVVILKQDNNTVIHVNQNFTTIDLRQLKDVIDEDDRWFYHHNGHLACCGSRKNPTKCPTKYTVDQLVYLVSEIMDTPIPIPEEDVA